jgi:hypothetical protein
MRPDRYLLIVCSLGWTIFAGDNLRAGDLAGQVVDSHTGEGILRARVTIGTYAGSRAASEDFSGLVIWTDRKGNFRFRNLPDGRFWVRAAKGGYLGGPAQAGAGGSEASVRISVRSAADPVTLRLTRQAVIKGRVTDEAGHGLTATIRLIPDPADERHRGKSRFIELDRSGEFRFAGLEEGRYYLGVDGRFDRDTRKIYPLWFFPDKTGLQEARAMDVRQGQEEEVEFRLHPVPGYQIGFKFNCEPVTTPRLAGDSGLIQVPEEWGWDEQTKTLKISGVPSGVYVFSTRCLVEGKPVDMPVRVTVDGAGVTSVVTEPAKP